MVQGEDDVGVNEYLSRHSCQSGISELNKGFVLPNFHIHCGYEIIFVERGYGRFCLDDSCEEINTHDLVIIDAIYPHDTEVLSSNGMTAIMTHFNDTCLAYSDASKSALKMIFPWIMKERYCIIRKDSYRHNLVSECLNVLAKEAKTEEVSNNYSSIIIPHLLTLVLLEIVQSIKTIDKTNLTEHRSLDLVTETLLYINSNLGQPPRLEVIAERLGVSMHHLSRVFKKAMKVSFRHFVQKRRALESKHLLMATDMSIESISEKLGYSAPPAFTRSFFSVFGETPMYYRNNNHNG